MKKTNKQMEKAKSARHSCAKYLNIQMQSS